MSFPEIAETAAPKRKRGRPKGSKNKSGYHHPDPQIALTDTVNEFCVKMKCSRVVAYDMMRKGQLKYIKFRKRRRIPHSEYQRLGVVS